MMIGGYTPILGNHHIWSYKSLAHIVMSYIHIVCLSGSWPSAVGFDLVSPVWVGAFQARVMACHVRFFSGRMIGMNIDIDWYWLIWIDMDWNGLKWIDSDWYWLILIAIDWYWLICLNIDIGWYWWLIHTESLDFSLPHWKIGHNSIMTLKTRAG